ncbi:MAG: ABC transporter ATP-binding protein, partial [Halobacteriaceae archaeon]
MTASSVLNADSISLERNGEFVLDGINFTIESDDQLLIRGPSGAGKTSLFYVLALLENPDRGSIEINGRDVTSISERARAKIRRNHVGIVFQDFRLIPDLTVRQNVALPQEHGDNVDDEWIHELLDELGITNLASRYPESLSGGEKQRVAIARALSNKPSMILADEPTGQLDPATADDVLDLLFHTSNLTGAAL